jgi:large subunit ribosomal protein L21e
MSKSHGERRKFTKKLKKRSRERGLSPVSRAVQDFEPGDRANVVIDSSVHHGMPNPKFHGKTGTVITKRGRSYVLEVSDQKATKTIIVAPEHLRPQT